MFIKGSAGGSGPPFRWREMAEAEAYESIREHDAVALRDFIDFAHYRDLELIGDAAQELHLRDVILSHTGRYIARQDGRVTTVYRKTQNGYTEVVGTFTAAGHDSLDPQTAAQRLAFSPDEAHIAAVHKIPNLPSDIKVYRIDASALTEIFSNSGYYGSCIRYSPDGTMLAVGTRTRERLVPILRNGNTYTVQTPVSGTATIREGGRLSFSKDGNYLYMMHIGIRTLFKRSGNTFVEASGVTLPTVEYVAEVYDFFSPYDGRFYAPRQQTDGGGSVVRRWIDVHDFSGGAFTLNQTLTSSIGSLTDMSRITFVGKTEYLLVQKNNSRVVLQAFKDRYEIIEADSAIANSLAVNSADPLIVSSADGQSLMLPATVGQMHYIRAYGVDRKRCFFKMTKKWMLDFGQSLLGAGYAMANYTQGETARANMLKELNNIWVGT